MNVVRASLRYPVVTIVVVCIVVIAGIAALLSMQRTEDPDFSVRHGLVVAQYPGADSAQVEAQVVKPLEDRIFRFPEVRRGTTFSTSRHGVAVVNVELEDAVVDPDAFWTKLRQALGEMRAADLPAGVRGPVLNTDFGETVALLIAVHGKRFTSAQLRDRAYAIRDRMRGVRDVAKLTTYGEQSEEITVAGDLGRTARYGVTPAQVVQALHGRNDLASAGTIEAGAERIPLRASGAFDAIDRLRDLVVAVSPSGHEIRLGDVARVSRGEAAPSFVVRYDGDPSVLISVEMQRGRNVVQLGEQLDRVLAEMAPLLPPDLKIDFVADQPRGVRDRLTHLGGEFALALASVVVVTLVLLPLRVALISALAIPVTICATLAAMNLLGIGLQQVSISALVLVLGIVVDDAIVIVDTYLDLLDRGVSRDAAAVRCVACVVVPVGAATLAIVASFLPLLILRGSAGEFIRSLPLTVAIALAVSFVTAICLTPLLCRFFIRDGLRARTHATRSAPSVLDRLQTAYDRAIGVLMRRKIVAVGIGVGAVIAGGLTFALVPQQFFPAAERDQFVIDVWMPQGARFAATDATSRRIETVLARTPGVVHEAAFIGQSAPRFYYNVSPQQPDPAYAQIVVQTDGVARTPALVDLMRDVLARAAPEATVVVKELQQGAASEAPLEVRISGDDVAALEKIGARVQRLIEARPEAQLVHRDFLDDSYVVDVAVDRTVADRLGVRDADVAQVLAGSLDGAQAGTYREGDRAIPIVLRRGTGDRANFHDVRDTYVAAPVGGASVPLRAVATLRPAWETSRIVRRGGRRTLTIESFVRRGAYASDLRAAVRDEIAAIPLPPGYAIAYGGEYANQNETFPQMTRALAISLLAIFLIVLAQFRSIRRAALVMSAIPLALVGAAVGLLATRNAFGFTAFLGLISLGGIVVRNAIILVEYVDEQRAAGRPIEEAALDAGKRRLRPIFLTTMAAAVGVTPMIAARSNLWSPLAAVIAFGLVFSMFLTLLVVPVLYVLAMRERPGRARRTTALLGAIAFAVACAPDAARADGAPVVTLTLRRAIALALERNAQLAVADAAVDERAGKARETRAAGRARVDLGAGTLAVANPGAFRDRGADDGRLLAGGGPLAVAGATVVQPLSELPLLRAGARIADADRRLALLDAEQGRRDVALSVRKLYYGIVVGRRKLRAAQAQALAARAKLHERASAVGAGTALAVERLAADATLARDEAAVDEANAAIADAEADLAHALDLDPHAVFALAAERPDARDAPPAPQDTYEARALAANADLLRARERAAQADDAVGAIRAAAIPSVDAFGAVGAQRGVALPSARLLAAAAADDAAANELAALCRREIARADLGRLAGDAPDASPP